MKNNTKEVQQLKQQVLDLTDKVMALEMLIYFYEHENETKKLEIKEEYNDDDDNFVAGCNKCGEDVSEINEIGLCNKCK